jgi:multidrug efflux pump subunit AcrA (membrane-fusion protein)
VTLIAAAIALAFAWPTLFSPPTGQSVRASGRIEGREITLAAKTIQARVKRLLVDEGDTVAKGQLLAELDATQVEAQVAAAGASVANLDAQVRQAALMWPPRPRTATRPSRHPTRRSAARRRTWCSRALLPLRSN